MARFKGFSCIFLKQRNAHLLDYSLETWLSAQVHPFLNFPKVQRIPFNLDIFRQKIVLLLYYYPMLIFHNQSHDTVPTRVALPSNFGDKVTTSHQSTLISSSNLKITNKNDRYYMKWIVVVVAINVLHANRACNCVQWDDIFSWGVFVALKFR